MSTYLSQLLATLLAFLPSLLAALAILVIGVLAAFILSSLVSSLLHRVRLDQRIANLMTGNETPSQPRISAETWISRGVFWLILLFTLVMFLQTLNLTLVSQPLNLLLTEILAYIPGILGALILLFVAWLVATFLRIVVIRVLSASGFTRRLSTDAQMKAQDRVSLSQTLGNIVYWLVFLLFLPAILGALNLQGILAPVQRMVDQILGVLPNILGAVVIFGIGWFVARIIRQIVTNLLAGLGIDRLGSQAGMQNALGEQRLSGIIGTVVYVLILIPVVVAALNALNIPAVSVPASNMLNALLNALPNIFAAFLIIAVSYFLARFVGGLVASLLAGLGFNRLFVWLGLYRAADQAAVSSSAPVEPLHDPNAPLSETVAPQPVTPVRTTPSEIAGYIVMVGIILFAVMEAAQVLGFAILATLISELIVSAVQILFGLVIFGIGLYLSSQADRVIRDSGSSQASILAPAARAAIIIFSGALALRQMGIAESIVNLAFGLLLGALAVAVALAFGLGGREIAARQLERWQQSMRSTPGPGPSTMGQQGRPAEFPDPDKN